jgi:type VI protein secretion system component VasF
MDDSQNEIPPRRRYLWPWLVAAAFVLAVLLAIAWLSYAVHREKQERDFSAPLPGSAAH